MLTPIKASTLVFDLDGTLTDPSEGIANCVNHALSSAGYAQRTLLEVSAEIGPPLDLMLKKFIPDIQPSQVCQLVTIYRERFQRLGYAENRLFDGIREVLSALQSSGHRMGVCTSKPERPARQVLEHFELLDYFEFVSGGDIGKKKQEQLSDLLQAGTIDQEAVMIGDRSVDLSAAHNNALRSVGVLWGFGEVQELRSENPVAVLEEVPELLSCFKC